ncbi:MAG TPA: hypothetical protein VD704_14005 [Gaiellaceae bacterium]|nr:hypothetical protein [Gaiellaceae bacterium]
MLLVWLIPPGTIILLLTLVIALYLTVLELREMQPPPRKRWWAWWISFVFFTHFIGYLLLRGYAAYRRSQQARA